MSNYEKLLKISEYRFARKHMRTNSRDNPKKVVPSRFVIHYNDERVVLSYHSLIVEGPKSLVCKYINRYPQTNSLPARVIVKYQLKFQTCAWSDRLKYNITKRYLDPDKGDVLCTGLPSSDRLCKYFGTYCLVADPRVEAPDRWKSYQNTPAVPDLGNKNIEEAFVIQIFDEVKGCDMYSFLAEDGPICGNGQREDMFTCLQIMSDIFEGLNLMHKEKFYHGDLKPENVMLFSENPKGERSKARGNVRATIIDFDFAAKIEHDRIKRGTPRYLSPEYLQAYRGHIDLASLGVIGREFDIWAVGAIMWTLFYGGKRGEKLYFSSYTTDQLKNQAMTSKVIQAMMSSREYTRFLLRRCGKENQGAIKDAVRVLIMDLLSYEPENRPTALQAYRRVNDILAVLTQAQAHNGTVVSSCVPNASLYERPIIEGTSKKHY